MKTAKEISKINARNARLNEHKLNVENRSFRRSSYFRGIAKAMRENSIALARQIRAEIAPIIQREIEAWNSWERKLGRPFGVTATHEGIAYSAPMGATADQEVNDTDRALIATTETGNLN